MKEQPNPASAPHHRVLINWHDPVAYDQDRKSIFHRAAKERLKSLALQCAWPEATYDLRSNMAGIAVSGEVTLHHDHVYICVTQERFGGDSGILFRSCNGRTDYTGGKNNFAPLSLLDDPAALAERILKAVPSLELGGAQ